MTTWLVMMVVKYMRWRGEYNDEQVEAIRRTVQETV
jgi:hypothetical protein